MAVTVAAWPYPGVCFGWDCPEIAEAMESRQLDDLSADEPAIAEDAEAPQDPVEPGLVWLTEADARGLAPTEEALSYVVNLKLGDPADAPAFVNDRFPTSWTAPVLQSWQDIRDQHDQVVQDQRRVLQIGSRLLGLLAVASIAVLVGGRMVDQTRRVGLLKAVGGTPRLVAVVLLTEYLVLALLAAAAGLAAGWLAAPLLTDPGAGLLGSAGAPSLTLSAVGQVTAVALGVAVIATFVPAVRAAAHQHRPHVGRRRPLTPAHPVVDRDLGTPARRAAPRVAGGRPPTAPRRAERGQHRGHGHRDRGRDGSQGSARPRRPARRWD